MSIPVTEAAGHSTAYGLVQRRMGRTYLPVVDPQSEVGLRLMIINVAARINTTFERVYSPYGEADGLPRETRRHERIRRKRTPVRFFIFPDAEFENQCRDRDDYEEPKQQPIGNGHPSSERRCR